MYEIGILRTRTYGNPSSVFGQRGGINYNEIIEEA